MTSNRNKRENDGADIAVREGLSKRKALEGIKINPAKNLIVQKLGSIEKGKDADLVLWTHRPFHYFAKLKWTMIEGKIIFSQN